MQGQFCKDASDRTTYELYEANSSLLFEVVPILETRFGFKVIYTLDGIDQLFIDLQRDELDISACWDVWSGVYIVALTEKSTEIILEIGNYLNELWGREKDG